MNKRKVTHLNKDADNVEGVIHQLREVQPRIQSIAVAIAMEPLDEDDADLLVWYVKDEDCAKVLGLLDVIKYRLTQDVYAEDV